MTDAALDTSDEKLMAVVEALAGREFAPLALTDVARMAGLPVSTARAKLAALEKRGWAERAGERWRLGPWFVSAAMRALDGARGAAQHIVNELARLSTCQSTGGDHAQG